MCVLAAQRSAHELPLVEKQDMDGCSVLGGQQMILTGQNFSSDSKVVFMEKTQGELTSHCGFHNKRALSLIYCLLRLMSKSVPSAADWTALLCAAATVSMARGVICMME